MGWPMRHCRFVDIFAIFQYEEGREGEAGHWFTMSCGIWGGGFGGAWW